MAGTSRQAQPNPEGEPPVAHVEIEAKFVVPDLEAFEKLASLEALGGYGLVPRGERRITDRYFDTQRRALLRASYACRRRTDDAGGPEVVTVKGLGGARDAVHRRFEYEAQVQKDSPPGGWPAGPGRDIVIRLAGEDPLVELFAVRQCRVVRDVEREGRRVAVMSLDRVEFGGPEAPPACELEIELTPAGAVEDLDELRDALRQFGLRPQALTKFERALARVEAAGPAPPMSPEDREPEPPPAASPAGEAEPAGSEVRRRRKAGRVAVQADEPMTEAGRKILRFHWEQALAHEAGTIEGTDPEELHDMRVATRRQRAALRIVAPHFRRKGIRRLREGLRALGGRLGAVRDLDVLLASARQYQATLDAAEARAFQPIIDAWTRRDEEARRQMLAHLGGPDYADFKQRYARFLDTPGAGARKPDDRPVRPTLVAHVLPAELWAHHGAVSAYQSLLPGAPVELLHELRIEGKRLRYLLEFFRDVLDRCAGKAIETMVALQDHLGEMQDGVVAMGLVREFLSGPDAVATPGAPAAAARYLEARQMRIEELRRTLDRPWSKVAGPALKACLSRAVATL